MTNKKRAITIVDDDEFLLDMYAIKFRKEGYAVTTYSDGSSAIDGISESNPDIVLLDVVMPGMDGIEVLQKLKSEENTKDIPVVLMTNLDGEDVRKRGAQSGALYFINKAAYLPKAVVRMVDEILE